MDFYACYIVHKHSLNILKTGKKKWIFCDSHNIKTSPNDIMLKLVNDKKSNNKINNSKNKINEIFDLKNDLIKSGCNPALIILILTKNIIKILK